MPLLVIRPDGSHDMNVSVREGRTNAQIASEIGFSVPTVKSELARLCVLLGATGRSEVAAKAARAGY